MWPLYLSPVYAATLRSPLLHAAVHAHFFVGGLLLAFALVGADPISGRGSRRVGLATLFAAMAAHDILAQYLYVCTPPRSPRSRVWGRRESWRFGAELLWYGGDVFEVALAVAFFARWYAATWREYARTRHRIGATHRPFSG